MFNSREYFQTSFVFQGISHMARVAVLDVGLFSLLIWMSKSIVRE
jgi:hypothetical protein